MIKPMAAVALYGGGILVGIMATLAWQAHRARIRRWVWDWYAGLPSEYQR